MKNNVFISSLWPSYTSLDDVITILCNVITFLCEVREYKSLYYFEIESADFG